MLLKKIGPILLLSISSLFCHMAWAILGDILFTDNFEAGFGQWATAGAGDASIGAETSNSAGNSMRIRWNTVDLTFSNRIGLPADPTPVGNGTFITGMHDPANPITLNSSNNAGNVDATLNVPTYLEFDWDGDPTGKATFGIFDINPRQIYIREIY